MECGDKIPTMIKIKQEVDEEPESSVTGGYQVFFIKQEVEEEDFRQDGVEEDSRQGDVDEDSTQDDEVEMQVTTGSSSESVGNVPLENKDSDLGWQLSGEDGEEDEREEQSEMEDGTALKDSSAAPSVVEGLGRSGMKQPNLKEKKVCLAKKLQFVESNFHRCKAWSNRVTGLLKKAHQLAELTKCQVFVYLQNELSRITYWGTTDAMQLFQPVMDSPIVKANKHVRRVHFVTPSMPSEDPCDATTCSSESRTPDSERPLVGYHQSDAANKASKLSSPTNESSAESVPSVLSTVSHSTIKSTPQEPESPSSKRTLTKTKTTLPWVNPRKQKLIVAEKLQVMENVRQRCKSKSNRVKGILSKAHQLAELTKCQVFLYMKDEFSKTTYWGTSDAMELFQPTIDSVVTKGGKSVRSVNFVAPSKAVLSKNTVPKNREASDIDKLLVGRLGSDASSKDFVPSSTWESSKESTSLSTLSTHESSAESNLCMSSPKSTSQGLESLLANSTLSKTKKVKPLQEKTVFLDKTLQFKEKSSLRCKSKATRIKGIFKKAHALTELTKCEVFLYVKDEFSKTTYWGTSDALQLFQSTIDSLIRTENKPVWSVKFVVQSRPSEDGEGTPLTSSVAPNLHGELGSDTSSHDAPDEESLLSKSTDKPSSGSTLQITTSQSSPESTPCRSTANSTSQELEAPVESRSLCKAKTVILPVKAKEKIVFLEKKLQFVETLRMRHKARSNRIKGVLKKGHQLAEITSCKVFLYVKDEYSKTTYWGTKDALQLFQPTIDSVMKGGKTVRSVKFVAPSKSVECPQGTPPTNSEYVDPDRLLGESQALDMSNQESVPSSVHGSSPGSTSTMNKSTQNSSLVTPHHPALKSTPVTPHYPAPKSTSKRLTRKSTPESTMPYSLRRRTTPRQHHNK